MCTDNYLVSYVVLIFLLLASSVPTSSGDVCADFWLGPAPSVAAVSARNSSFLGRFIFPTIVIDCNISSPIVDVVPSDFFISRFTGFLRPPRDGLYRFSILGDDATIVFLDNGSIPIVGTGRFGIAGSSTAGFLNTTGYNWMLYSNTSYPIDVHHQERRSWAAVELSWGAVDPANVSSIIVADHIINSSETSQCTSSSTSSLARPLTIPRLSARDEIAVLEPVAQFSGWCAHWLLSYDRWFSLGYGPNVAGYVVSTLEPVINVTLPRGVRVPPLGSASTQPPGFSVSWQGYLIPPETANYTLWFWMGNQFRVVINGMTVLQQDMDNGDAMGKTEFMTPPFSLTAGVPYRVQIDNAESQQQPAYQSSGSGFPQVRGIPPDTTELRMQADWRISTSDGLATPRTRIPAAFVRTIGCPAVSALALNSNITGDRTLNNGNFIANSSVLLNGNITLTNSVLVVSSLLNITGSFTIGSNSAIILNSTGIIYTQGNVVFASGSVVSITNVSTSGIPVLAINGTATIRNGSALQISLTPNTTIELRGGGQVTIPLITYGASDGPTQFNLTVTGLQTQPCEKVTTQQVDNGKSLALLLSLDRTGCSTPSTQFLVNDNSFPLWAIGPIVGGVVLIAVIVSAIVFFRKRKSDAHHRMRLKRLTNTPM